MPTLSIRLSLLMHFTLSALRSLSHENGTPIVLIHSPSIPYSSSTHGAVIALSVVSSTGKLVAPRTVECRASLENIHIRAGCMCNPGAASELLGLADVLAGFKFRKPSYSSDSGSSDRSTSPLCPQSASASAPQSQSLLAPKLFQDVEDRDGPTATQCTYAVNKDMERLIDEEGVVRIGFGLASSLEDAWAFISFIRGFRDGVDSVMTEKEFVSSEHSPRDAKRAGKPGGSYLCDLWCKTKARLRFAIRICSNCSA